NAEVFSPSYIYQAGRPVISAAPSTGNYGQTVAVKTSTTTLSQVVLMKLGAVTNSLDESARRVPLSWTKGTAGTFNVRLPTNPNAAPPGHYLLFILDSRGVPSEGRILQLLAAPPVVSFVFQPKGASLLSGESDSPSPARPNSILSRSSST